MAPVHEEQRKEYNSALAGRNLILPSTKSRRSHLKISYREIRLQILTDFPVIDIVLRRFPRGAGRERAGGGCLPLVALALSAERHVHGIYYFV